MNYLERQQLQSLTSSGSVIEYWLGSELYDNFVTFKWLAIEKTEEGYVVLFHHVFDDSDDGLDSIYHFSHVEPDDLYGLRLLLTPDFEYAIDFLNKKYDLDESKFLLSGGMDDEMKKCLSDNVN
jgi:hypothetical protein